MAFIECLFGSGTVRAEASGYGLSDQAIAIQLLDWLRGTKDGT